MEQNIKSLLLISLITPLFAYGSGSHLPLDLTIEETQKLWKDHQREVITSNKNLKASKVDPSIAKAIAGGEVLNKWLKEINKNRTTDNQLRLTSRANPVNSSSNSAAKTLKEDRQYVGFPINKPTKYGPKTIKEDLEKIFSETPKEMLDVIYRNSSITGTNPVSDAIFIQHGRVISRVYQYAVRWETVIKRSLSHYKKKQKRDVRGFYYLKKENDLDGKLNNFKNLSNSERKEIESHLFKICLNNDTSADRCKKKLAKAIKKDKLVKFKDKYWKKAQENWNSFWVISKPRKDVVWNSSAPNSMKVVFKNPKDDKIANWLKDNIEDEYKNETWQLEFNFKDSGIGVSYLKFKPGVTPHVSGGNVIVMDANASIDEYSVKWTIRHEYGHILRLPDCYFEFYDEQEQLAVNYQLDTTDLMCSRSGKFNKRIYDELKRVYYTEK